MSDDEDDEPTAIELDGDGPFILPLCDTDVGLALGQTFALLGVTTLDGKVVQIPFGHGVLQVLHEIIGKRFNTSQGTTARCSNKAGSLPRASARP
jgi:hypothetical protein